MQRTLGVQLTTLGFGGARLANSQVGVAARPQGVNDESRDLGSGSTMPPCRSGISCGGPLESFYYNTGLPFDWAPSFNALIVFGEHRRSWCAERIPFLGLHF